MDNDITMLYETLGILEKGVYVKDGHTVPLKLKRTAMVKSDVFLPDEIDRLRRARLPKSPGADRCAYDCVNRDSFARALELVVDARRLGGRGAKREVLVLNFANPVSPGGGVRGGARAQEEDLCRRSSLLLALEGKDARPYYRYNRARDPYVGSDAVIITPRVEILRGEDGELLEESAVVAVMTCAAPVKYGLSGMTARDYERLFTRRVEGMLLCAAREGYRFLVLGAFGCGAFGNDARDVSDIFYKVLRDIDRSGTGEGSVFRRVDFAVLDRSPERYNFNEFCRNFRDFYGEGSDRGN